MRTGARTRGQFIYFKYLLKLMVEVIGETFSIKERKMNTRGKRFTKLKHILRIYIFEFL